MRDDSMSDGGEQRLHVARAKYMTAYVLLSYATAQLEKLAVTRGAYKRTRRSIVRAAAIVMLVGGLLGLATPRTSHATPVFAPPVANAFGSAGFFAGVRTSPVLADIDGDGDLDLFVGGFIDDTGVSKYNGTALFENTGTATAPVFTSVGLNPFGLLPSYVAGNLGGYLFHGGPALVDIDDDGDLDFFTQNASYGTDFFENTGTATVPAFTVAALPTGFVGGTGNADTFVDIDGDGDFDVFHGIGGGSAYISFQENIGTAAAANFDVGVSDPFGLSAPDDHPTLEFVDVDGDGDYDTFIGKYDGALKFQSNSGTPLAPAFGPAIGAPFGFTSVPGNTSKPTFGDIDGDGDVDMFYGTDYGPDLYFYENVEINCGDGILDPSEVCDGAALDSETCETLGYDSGALACASDCLSFNTAPCAGVPCPPTPSGTCLVPGKSQFQVKDNADPAKDSLKFKWQKGATFAQLALGNPATTNDVALCIYDRTLGVPALVGRVGVPTNAFWVTKDPKGYQLVDKTGTYDGVTKVQLKTGDAGKTSASLQAKGANLTLPPPISATEYFDQDTTVTVQLIDDAGICWSSDFAVAGTTKNDAVQFKAK